MPDNPNIIVPELIERKIILLRGQKVILDADIAELYGVETKELKRAVNRNIDRFPDDFLLYLTSDEYNSLRRQFGTLKRGTHTKYLPYAFTEEGVAMLSTVLRSSRAVHVNIAIMRAFVQLRRFLESNKELAIKMEELEKAVAGHDEKINLIFQAIKQLIEKKDEPPPPGKAVGYKVG